MSADGFGVYIHWPYCTRLCPYCDFNIYRARGRDPAPLRNAIAADIAAHAARIGRRRVDTVFFGGGTPSLLAGADIAMLLGAINDAFGLARGAEITLESNPEDSARFGDQAAAGVNRFSIGVQALVDADLAALGRAHDAATGRSAVERAARTGRRVSLDMIYARPGQGEAAWRAELQEALALPAEHFSLYQLTAEPGTAYERAVARGRTTPPADAEAAALYQATQALCDAAGAPAYEISNHARSDAARSRHNLLYWQGGAWIGVGPGAHGRIECDGRRLATKAHDRPEAYIAAVASAGVGHESAMLTRDETADEAVLMGLRVAEGLARARIESLRGRPLNPVALAEYAGAGLLADDGVRVRLTPAGRLFADRIAAALAM